MSWPHCCKGPGEYHYGSPWSPEQPRQNDLASIRGVTVVSTQAITVYAVKFAQWANWDAYLKNVSTNAKRNAKRAEKTYADLAISRRCRLEHDRLELTLA
jgi:hypothetical protein